MKLRTIVALAVAVTALHGCIPYYAGAEQNLYAPGGALADKHEGPMLLATSTDVSLSAMFPKGTPKATVMQALGNPSSSSTSSDGGSSQVYMHSFTSYSQKMVQSQVAVMEYDKAGTVSKITFTKSQNTW